MSTNRPAQSVPCMHFRATFQSCTAAGRQPHGVITNTVSMLYIADLLGADLGLFMGRFLTKLGYASILMNEQVGIRYGAIGIIALLVLTGKDWALAAQLALLGVLLHL